MKIIPAIDIIGGRCVRLTQGDYNRVKTYHADPLELAKKFEDAGVARLHLVDLDGAKTGKVVNIKVLERITSQTNLTVDFGGGVQSDQDIEKVFNSGARQVTVGSIAVRSPEIFDRWLSHYGSDKIILGADVMNNKVAIGGWQEKSDHDIFQFLTVYFSKGVQYVICTDISKDGLLQGPSIRLYRQIINRIPELKLIASGGITSMEDINALDKLGVHGAIIGKAIYEGKIKLEELKTLH